MKPSDVIDFALGTGAFSSRQHLLSEVDAAPMSGSDFAIGVARSLEDRDQPEAAAMLLQQTVSPDMSRALQAQLWGRAADLIYMANQAHYAKPTLDRIAHCLERSAGVDPGPGVVSTLEKLCTIYENTGDARSLLSAAERLSISSEQPFRAHLWRSAACFRLGDMTRGLACLADAEQEIASASVPDFLHLIGQYLQFRRFDRALELIAFARDHGIEADRLAEFEAQVFYETGKFEALEQQLTAGVLESVAVPAVRRRLLYYRGMLLDRRRDFARAYDSFSEMNRIAAASVQDMTYSDSVTVAKAVFGRALPLYRRVSQPCTRVFLVGFPRSGTTLLETILDTQEQVCVMSEIDAVLPVRQAIDAYASGYPAALADLTDEQVRELRGMYEAYIEPYIESNDRCAVLVDKLPLNMLHAPLLKVLFPEAKFLHALRHPLDVCLSCFQQDFQLNSEMRWFTSLESCLRRYRDVNELFARYRDTFDLDIHTVRYEDMIDDLDTTVRWIFRFIDTPLDDGYRDFARRNRDKVIATPSRTQVVKPLYRSSIYKWQNYEAFIRPHVHLVERFIEAYGYTV